MKSVLVFKTSVTTGQQVRKLQPLLDRLTGQHDQWNFDLEDCDRILRVEALSVQAAAIIEHLRQAGFACAELED